MTDYATTFNGFVPPEQNWSRLPNELIDVLPIINSMAEMKVILYVLRHTWGFQEFDAPKRITLDEFMSGRVVRGERRDRGTGLSKSAVIDGIERAVKHQFLIEYVDDTDKARIIKSYQLRMYESHTSGVVTSYTRGMKVIHRTKEKETLERNSEKKDSAAGSPASTQIEPPRAAPEAVTDVDHIANTVAPQSSLASNPTNIPPLVKNGATAEDIQERIRHKREQDYTFPTPIASIRAEMGKLLSERNPVTVSETVKPTITVDGYGPRALIVDNPPQPGHEWWYSADGAAVQPVAHLLRGGKGKPLCKPKHWKYPNPCLPQAAYVLCTECQRAATEVKADTIVKPLNDAVAKYIQEIDVAFADRFTGTLAQIIAGIWRTKLGRDKLTADDYAAIARSLEPGNEKGFIRWYKVQCKDCSIPNDKVKLRKWYAQFVTQTNGDNNGNSVRPKKDYGFGPKSK